jgi:hypothetical protein
VGQPIKRLYGTGEMGSIWGFLYQSGSNLGELLGLIRMAGVNVVAKRFSYRGIATTNATTIILARSWGAPCPD